MKKLGISVLCVMAAYLLLSMWFPSIFDYALTAGKYKVPYIYLGLGAGFVFIFRSVK